MLKRGRVCAASLAVLASMGIAGIVFAQTNDKGSKTAVIAVQITIKDYDHWRPIFDRVKPLRDKAGVTNARVYRDVGSPNELLVWNETSDVAATREALTSGEIRKAMQEAGVVGPPRLHVIPSP
jgi:quinol monooxygenase YgiN